MLLDSLVLSTITALGGYLIWIHLPMKVKMWFLAHPLLTRVGCAVSVYTLLGASVTALFAAGWLDLMIGLMLALASNKEASEAMSKLGAYISSLRKKLMDSIIGAVSNLEIKTEQSEGLKAVA